MGGALTVAVVCAGSENPDEIERKFWKSLRPTMDAPVYGADIVVSLCAA